MAAVIQRYLEFAEIHAEGYIQHAGDHYYKKIIELVCIIVTSVAGLLGMVEGITIPGMVQISFVSGAVLGLSYFLTDSDVHPSFIVRSSTALNAVTNLAVAILLVNGIISPYTAGLVLLSYPLLFTCFWCGTGTLYLLCHPERL